MSAEFEPLEQVRKDLRVVWNRSPIEPAQLRELVRRSDLHGWYQAGGHLALFATTGLLTYYFFDQGMWFGFVFSLFAHGTVGSFAGNAAHELGHGTVFRTKWLNRFFLRVYSVLGWHNFHEYAMSHTYHHRYTLYPKGDREVALPLNPSLKLPYLFQLFTFNVFGGLESHGIIPTVRGTIKTAFGKFDREWIEALYADQIEARKQAIDFARFILLFHLGTVVISIIFKLWLLSVLLTLFLFVGNWLKYFTGVPMHCGLRDNVPDFRLCARSITLDPLSEFLYWRMNWHTEHHMFAAVPCYNLKKLAKVIADDMPRPRTLVGAWREMRDTWRRQQEDPTYQHDTPLPRRADGASAHRRPPTFATARDSQ